MAWYAVEAIDSALDDAKELLLPFDWKLWAKLALIALLAGGVNGANLPSGGNGDGMDMGPEFGDGDTAFSDPGAGADAVTGAVTAVQEPHMLAMGAVMVLLIGVFLVLNAVFTFVFYESVLTRNVRIRPYARKHVRNGLQLLGLRLALIAALFSLVLAGVGLFFVNPFVGLAGLVLAVPLGIAWLVAMRLTNEFVPLTMMEHDLGVIDAWKRLYPVLREQWKQTGVYLLLRFALQIAVGIIALVGALAAAVPAVPFGIGGALLPGTVSVVLLVVAVAMWLVTFLVFVNGPVQTYLRYYTVDVYDALTA